MLSKTKKVGLIIFGLGIFSCIMAPALRPILDGAYSRQALLLTAFCAVAWILLGVRAILRAEPSTTTMVLLGLASVPVLFLWLIPLGGLKDEPGFHFAALGVFALLLSLLHGRFTRKEENLSSGSMVFFAILIMALLFSLGFRRMAPAASPLPTLIWGLYILGSLIGWGGMFRRALSPEKHLDWAQKAAFGMAMLVVLGGLLNLSWGISAWSIHILLAIGIARFGVEVFQTSAFRIPSARKLRPGLNSEILNVSRATPPILLKPELLLWIPIVAALLFQLAAAGAGTIDTVYQRPAFDLHDDEQAYLVFPEKMLQTGSMGPEPFEARRMLSMGGQSFLQAIVLSGLPLRAAHLFDMGIAPLILLGLVVSFGRRRKLDHRLILFSALLALVIPQMHMRGNTTALMDGVVLMLAWFSVLADSDPPSPFSVALLAAALVALKSTFIPAAVTIFLFSILFDLRRPGALRGHVATVFLIALFDLPWMISILSSSGTLLYPVFGKGTYGGVFTNNFSNIAGGKTPQTLEIVRSIWRHLLSCLPSVLLLPFLVPRRKNRAAYALALAAVVSVIALVVMGDPELHRAISRYSFPLITASFLALVLSCMAEDEDHGGKTFFRPALIAALVVGLGWMMINQESIRKNWDQVLLNFSGAVSGVSWVQEEEVQASEQLQKSLPEGEALLATLRDPALLDFSRRRIFIMSLPGMSMLPPGMPIFKGGDAVASYLLDHGIPLLAYGGLGDSHTLLKLSEEDVRSRYPDSKMRWALLRYHERYHRVVQELAHSRKHLYDDGRRLVCDLSRHVATFDFAENPERVEGLYRDLWTMDSVVVRGLKHSLKQKYLILSTRGWLPDGLPKTTPRLSIRGVPLTLIDEENHAFLYGLPEGSSRVFDLDIESSLFDPLRLGAAPVQPMIGFAPVRIELVEDSGLLEIPTAQLIQDIDQDLDPAMAWRKSGFFKDFNWTDGDATISGIHWDLSSGCSRLVVELNPVSPWKKADGGSKLRLWVNGIELKGEELSRTEYSFRLYSGARSIERLRFVSRTFRPSEQAKSRDGRSLGVPIRRVFLR